MVYFSLKDLNFQYVLVSLNCFSSILTQLSENIQLYPTAISREINEVSLHWQKLEIIQNAFGIRYSQSTVWAQIKIQPAWVARICGLVVLKSESKPHLPECKGLNEIGILAIYSLKHTENVSSKVCWLKQSWTLDESRIYC